MKIKSQRKRLIYLKFVREAALELSTLYISVSIIDYLGRRNFLEKC